MQIHVEVATCQNVKEIILLKAVDTSANKGIYVKCHYFFSVNKVEK
jgi:hypothetical protein